MAITRAQQAKQMLQDGGRIGFFTGMREQEQREKAAADRRASENRVAAATDIKSIQEALGTKGSITKEQQEARDRLRDQRETTRETIRENAREARKEELAETFAGLLPTRRNLFKRALVLPGAKERIRDQRKAYAEYLESMGVVPSSELTDTDDLFSFFEEQAFEEGPTVPGRTIKSYGDFILDEFGNPTVKYRGDIGAYRRDMGIDDRGPDDQLKALVPAQVAQPIQEPTEEKDDPNRFFRLFAEGGSVDDMEREAMFLGGITKGIKKAVRGIKKIAKSPIGKAALIAGGAGFFGMGPFAGLAKTKAGIGLRNLFGTGSFNPLKQLLTGDMLAPGEASGVGLSKFGLKLSELGLVNPSTMGLTSLGKFAALGIPSALAGAMTDEQKDEFKEPEYPEFNLQAYLNQPFQTQFRRLAAEGGLMREGYQEGSKEPVAKKTMPLLDMDGKEMDFREEGGFVPIGRMEKADDVPARLSKNEFVFTADAVRNAGDGDVDKGAEVMYNMMKNLESGGEVSEESQGLEGARKMFQTSQRLEEVL
jgi:hypothetical protein